MDILFATGVGPSLWANALCYVALIVATCKSNGRKKNRPKSHLHPARPRKPHIRV